MAILSHRSTGAAPPGAKLPARRRSSSKQLCSLGPWHRFAVTTRALDGPSYGERSGVTLLIDLFDDGPDIVIKPDFFTAGERRADFRTTEGADQLAPGRHALRPKGSVAAAADGLVRR